MKLVILDRGRVIDESPDGNMPSASDWHPLPGSLEAIARLCQAGYRVFIVGKHAGIGRGAFDYDALFGMNDRLQKLVLEFGGRIDGIEFAPEHPGPEGEAMPATPGMLKDLARRLQVNLEDVVYVGDSLADLEAARSAGARPVLVRSEGRACTENERSLADTEIHDDLAAFARATLTPAH